MKARIKRTYFRRLLRPMNKLDLSPGLVGRTFGIGTAAGLSATVGLQSVIVLAIWAVVRGSKTLRFNLPIAWVLTGITNPLTLVPFYTFYYSVGVTLLGRTEGAYDVNAIWVRLGEEGALTVALESWRFLLITLFGSLPFTLAGGVAAYYLGRWIGRRMADRREMRFVRLQKIRDAALRGGLPLSKRLKRGAAPPAPDAAGENTAPDATGSEAAAGAAGQGDPSDGRAQPGGAREDCPAPDAAPPPKQGRPS